MKAIKTPGRYFFYDYIIIPDELVKKDENGYYINQPYSTYPVVEEIPDGSTVLLYDFKRLWFVDENFNKTKPYARILQEGDTVRGYAEFELQDGRLVPVEFDDDLTIDGETQIEYEPFLNKWYFENENTTFYEEEK